MHNDLDRIKARLDRARAAHAGKMPTRKLMSLTAEYHAALFARIKTLRTAVKARTQGAV